MNQNTNHKPNLILIFVSILAILAVGLSVGIVIGLNNIPAKQVVNQNTSLSSIDSTSSISTNSSFNTQNSLSSSTSSTISSISTSSSLGLSSSNKNSNIAQFTSPYLPKFKINYDQNVWTKSGDITFEFESKSSKNFNLYSNPVNIKNPTFDLEINVIFPPDGDTACYPKNEFELKNVSKNFSLIVSNDAKNATLAFKNNLYDTNKLVGDELYILDYCPEGSYYTAGGNMSKTQFNFDIDLKSFENLINDTTYGKNNNPYIQIKLDTTKTATEADYQELGKFLDGIEGLNF